MDAISQDPASVPFFIQELEVCEGEMETALSTPEVSKLSLAMAP